MACASSGDGAANHEGISKAAEDYSTQGAGMRAMTWVRSARFEGWACSDCAWTFNPSGPPIGASLEEMKQNFERQRDKDFASHVCAKHPRTKSEKSS
jgi:hypothetical protein